MCGQGGPSLSRYAEGQCADATRRAPVTCKFRYFYGWVTLFTLFLPSGWAADAPASDGESLDVRVRLVWGAGSQPTSWTGELQLQGGEFSDLEPLGIEVDEGAALRLIDQKLVVRPLLPRQFDGCDVTIRGSSSARLEAALGAKDGVMDKLSIALSDVMAGPVRHAFGGQGAFLLVERAPGDRLRISWEGDHTVFDVGETWRLSVMPDLAGLAVGAGLELRATVRSARDRSVAWETVASLATEATEARGRVALEVPCPDAAGAYQLELAVVSPVSSARRFGLGVDASAPLTQRTIEFVVVPATAPDQGAKESRLSGAWEVESSWDPASPTWRQRIPDWAQLPRLTGAGGGRPLGNVRPTIRAGNGESSVVELPPTLEGAEPYWQAYPLMVASPGDDYAIEISIPSGASQQLALGLVEPDAAGRVTTTRISTSLYQALHPAGDNAGRVQQRVRCWPHTTAPVLVIANLSPTHAAQFGEIRLLRRTEEPAAEASPAVVAPQESTARAEPFTARRLAAAYVSTPELVSVFGGREAADGSSQLSVSGWQAFYDSGERMIRLLEESGCNAAVIAIAGDGACLAPIDGLGVSPRLDTRNLGGDGPDPHRKDVVELLLRLGDAAGVTLFPAISLSAPMPAIETAIEQSRAAREEWQWIGDDGQAWSHQHSPQSFPLHGRGAHYNLLREEVQRAVANALGELVDRYKDHPSFGGVAIQMRGEGYGVLPGLRWGLDDKTIESFSLATGVNPPGEGGQRFTERGEFLATKGRQAWTRWRANEVTKFYAHVADNMRGRRDDLQLILCLEEALTGAEATQGMRQAVSERSTVESVLLDVGVDLESLSKAPGIVVPRPRMLAPDDVLLERAVDMRWNRGLEIDEALSQATTSSHMIYYRSGTQRLASFDALSPFGTEATRLSLLSCAVPQGYIAREPLATALAQRDATLVVVGGAQFMSGMDASVGRMLDVYRRLPPAGAEVRTQRAQPVTVRVFREHDGHTVVLYNESPWPLTIDLPLGSEAPAPWKSLGKATSDDRAADTGDLQPRGMEGTLDVDAAPWSVELGPYDLAAWKIFTPRLRVGKPSIDLDDASLEALRHRLAQVDLRIANLAEERPYAGLANPSFEDAGAHGTPAHWQVRAGLAGKALVDDRLAHDGGRSLRLSSREPIGVAIESKSIALPATGQLTVRAQVRTVGMAESARLYAMVEIDDGVNVDRRYTTLGESTRLSESWSLQELNIDDLPLGRHEQMRVQFLLTGVGDAWIDDVQLVDLRIAQKPKNKILREFVAAKNALAEHQYVDCWQLVDEYWARFVVEHVAPSKAPMEVATRSEAPRDGATPPTQQPGFRQRVREFVPRIFR